jgi:type IV pilus assembly protein PilC
VLIGSGVPIVQALEILTDQAGDKNMKSIVATVREKVSGGTYLWEALSNYPKAFPKLYVALIRAGEASGSIDQMLKRLSRYLEDADRLRKLLKGAMMYPIIVISIGIGVVAAMLIFVIPKFEELLKSSGSALPAPTQFVIDLSHFLSANILYLIAGGGAAWYLLNRYLTSPEGRAVIHRTFFRAPLFGNIMQKGGVARFSRTMQTLLASGVNIIDAIDICKATIDNAILEEAVGKIRSEVEGGKTLGTVIGKLNVFPQMAVQMISVGESTGNLDKMLEKVADFYEEEVEALIGGMTKLIEPLILVFLGGAVGGLMIAMYLPIFKMGAST